MVTGVPASVWLNPSKAMADLNRDAAAVTPQFVIYSTSGSGDPVNCNAPGTYDDPAIVHAKDPSMAATAITQNGVSRQGAQVWTGLPAGMLDKLAFFHHGTYTIIHTEVNKVMRLQGAVNRNNMLPCALAQTLGPALGTITSQPVCLYGDLNAALVDDGIPLPMHPPSSLRNVLGVPQIALGSPEIMKLRDQSLDALNTWGKTRAKDFQKLFLDRYALSRDQARTVQEKLGDTLANINDDGVDSQISLAVALFQLNVAPVVAISIPFGGDNHYDGVGDAQLTAVEVPQHQTGVATLAKMYDQIQAAGLGTKVSFLLTNVFGRNLSKDTVANGRGHNDSHAVSLLYGPHIKGGVVGGVALNQASSDFMATPIHSNSGAGDSGGDIPYSDTLASMGKTFTAAVGGATDGLNFRAGTIVPSVLATG
jgi:hypothetical protein